MGPCVRRGDGCALWLPNWYRFICLVPLHLSNSPPCAGTASRSRRTFRAGFALSFRPLVNRGRRECRMRVAPEAACAAKSTGVSNQGYTATAGIPCTMVLTVSFVLSSVTMLVATVISGIVSTNLAPASERQDHTTSPSAQTPFVRAMTALGDVRPSHPLPNVRDDRDTPLLWAGTAQTVSLIWGKREAEYFCAKGWTGFRMRRFFARRANQFVD
jgi:hypothetical protein